ETPGPLGVRRLAQGHSNLPLRLVGRFRRVVRVGRGTERDRNRVPWTVALERPPYPLRSVDTRTVHCGDAFAILERVGGHVRGARVGYDPIHDHLRGIVELS